MNNKLILALIALMSAGVYAGLVHYGWTHRYGSPETFEVQKPQVLAVPFQSRSLKLEPGDLADDAWQDVPEVEVRLIPQMSQQPWTTGLTPAVRVQAFHDGNDIYFRLAWQDDVPNRTLSVDSFADGCAVAVPLDTAAPVQSIMMGFTSPVNVWHWQAHKGAQTQQEAQASQVTQPDYAYPFEGQETLPVSKIPTDKAVTDLLTQRAGSLTPKARQIVQGQAHWDTGTWTVVLKRSLRTRDAEQDCQFAWGRCPASFAVWDGDQGDRGARKSMSDWVMLEIQTPGGSGKAAGFADGEWANHRQAALAAATQNSEPWGEDQPYVARMPFFALASTAMGQSRPPSARQAEPEPRLVNVVAKRFSYTPNRISVRKGERLTLRLESLDVTHGLYLDGYGVNIKARPGMVGKATFTADKTGRFSFRCSETCGEFHPYMIGFLEVTPNSRFVLFAAATGVAFLVILSVALLRGKEKREL